MRKRFALGKFDESKHERDEGGRFASKGGGSAPSIRQRQLVERSPGRLFEEKWGRRGGAFNAAREAPVGNGHDTRFVAWQKVGPKNPNLPPEYTGSTEREAPVDGYTSIGMTWQRPKQLSRKEDEAVRAGLTAAIRDQRDAAIERATERGLIPEGTDRKALSRAYNLAAMRALHEFGIGSLDYRMSDDLKAEMMPLTPAMRFFQRRLGDQMRSRPDTKGKWQPYHEEFKVPYDDMRLDRRPGKGNQLRLKWPKSMGSHTDFIKAVPVGALAKARPVFPRADPHGGRFWLAIDAAGEWGANKWAKIAGRGRSAERPRVVERAKAAAAAANAELPPDAPRRKPKQEAWEAAKAFDAETAARRHYNRQRGRAAVHLSMGAAAGAGVGAAGMALAQRRDDQGRFSKAAPVGALAKADAAAVGAASTVTLADKIIAARKAKRAGAAGPRPGTAPPEVMAVLPEMRRVLHDGAARRGMMAAAPQQQRHHGNHTIIRDPRRSLTELLR